MLYVGVLYKQAVYGTGLVVAQGGDWIGLCSYPCVTLYIPCVVLFDCQGIMYLPFTHYHLAPWYMGRCSR